LQQEQHARDRTGSGESGSGKDRTGFGIVLLLTALGVPHHVVLLGYVLTNRTATHGRAPGGRRACKGLCSPQDGASR